MAQLSVAHAQNILPDMVISGHVTDVTSGHVTDVTSGHVTDFTSGHVTSGSTSQHLRKYDLSCTHILLTSLCDFWVWRVTIENFVQIFRIFLVL